MLVWLKGETMLAVVELNMFQQVAAIVVGVFMMLGCVIAYKKYDVDGFIAFLFALFGFALVLLGIGGGNKLFP